MSSTNKADWVVSHIDENGVYNGDVNGDVISTLTTVIGTLDLSDGDFDSVTILLSGSAVVSNWIPEQNKVYQLTATSSTGVSLGGTLKFEGSDVNAAFDAGDSLSVIRTSSSNTLIVMYNNGVVFS